MFAPTFALLNRSFREDVRLLRSHLLRFVFVALILWLLWMSWETSRMLGAPGLHFCSLMTHLNVFLISLAGVSFFATSITEEKEEQTLGLMTMAGISPLALLLGKSTSRLITGVLLLSVQFPFTLLAITLGGVTREQLLAAYFALVSHLLFAGNLGLFCSVVCARSRGAAKLALVLLSSFFFGPYLVGLLLTRWIGAGWLNPAANSVRLVEGMVDVVRPASVWNRLGIIMQTGYAPPWLSYQAVSNLVLGAMFFGGAWVLFPRFAQETESAGIERGIVSTIRGRLRRFRPGRSWNNALIWKDFHFIAGGTLVLLGKFAGYASLCVFVSVILKRQTDLHDCMTAWGMAFGGCMVLVAAIELVMLAARIFQDEIRSRTLAMVILLPRSVRWIAYAKAAGCLLALLPALTSLGFATALVMGGMLMDNSAHRQFQTPSEDDFIAICIWTDILIHYVLFLHLIVLISLYIRWWTVPLAVLLMIGWNIAFFTCFLGMGSQGGGGPGVAIATTMIHGMIGSFVLVATHVTIGERLRGAAAE